MAEPLARSADRWLALFAGRNTWHDAEREVDPITRSLAITLLIALVVATSSALVVRALDTARRHEPWLRGGSVVLIASALLAGIPAALTVAGRLSPSRSAAVNLVVRSTLGVLISAAVFNVAPHWWALVSWPLGIAMGCDAAMTASSFGWAPSGRQFWRAIVLSPFHVGVVGGLVGITATRGSASLVEQVVPIYVTLVVWSVVAGLTFEWCTSLQVAQRHLVGSTRTEAVRDEHRRSAHWLHDDICAQLRLVTLRVQSGGLTMSDVERELEELDFALRLRQLDELLQGGRVRLAEVLQPFLRRAQSVGVTFERVPSYDVASVEIDHDAGLLVRRAAAVLTSNALNAGAHSLAFDVTVEPHSISLSLVDDAGGFDSSELAPGRGLWSLRQDLGEENLVIERLHSGSRVTAHISLQRMEPTWHT